MKYSSLMLLNSIFRSPNQLNSAQTHSVEQHHIFLICGFKCGKHNLMLILNQIYHLYCLIPFLSIHTTKISVSLNSLHINKKSISSRPYLLNNYRENICFGQFFVNKIILLFVCLYFLYCDTLKKFNHNHMHYHFNEFNVPNRN